MCWTHNLKSWCTNRFVNFIKIHVSLLFNFSLNNKIKIFNTIKIQNYINNNKLFTSSVGSLRIWHPWVFAPICQLNTPLSSRIQMQFVFTDKDFMICILLLAKFSNTINDCYAHYFISLHIIINYIKMYIRNKYICIYINH